MSIIGYGFDHVYYDVELRMEYIHDELQMKEQPMTGNHAMRRQ
jgi:hypothetical protein